MNLTREIAAERSGISASTVKNIENGHGGSIWALVSLCRTYGHANWVYELAPEEQIDFAADTTQAYFDRWKEQAVRVGELYGTTWVRENQPAMYLLLEMLDGSQA